MGLRLYNTLTRTLEEFTPLKPPTVTMYVCGPTVYDVPHIGHARSAYIFDVLRRYLAVKGFEVRFVRNVTDVDDKIIEKARQETGDKRQETGNALKTKCKEVAARYLTSYHEAMDRLGIARPDVEPKATEHVVPDEQNVQLTGKIDASMTGFISQLIKENIAYPAGGDVYFSVRKFSEYGKLSNRSLDDLQAGARVEPGEHKGDPLDFALWKAAKPDEPSWSSPWGPGRPGWHIECSVMSTAYLGDAFDIHGGGVDLVFPHHENELAQARAIGKPFARTWIHNGLLTVNGEKMSKSLGNFITVEQALNQCHDDLNALKVFFLGTHYRSPIDYTSDNLRAASGRSNRFYDFLFAADSQRSSAHPIGAASSETTALFQEFEGALDDDLNTPQALAALDKMVSQGYALWKMLEGSSGRGAQEREIRVLRGEIVAVGDAVFKLSKLFGLDYTIFQKGDLPPEEETLFNQYEAARQRKDFETSDKLREELFKKGFLVRDTFGGSIPIPIRQRA